MAKPDNLSLTWGLLSRLYEYTGSRGRLFSATLSLLLYTRQAHSVTDVSPTLTLCVKENDHGSAVDG